MTITCTECGSEVEIDTNVIDGEIISCPICGIDHVVIVDASGLISLKELTIEGEDWGE
ncbi:lysine biosynthesis protein [Candidatus Bathyarchaeota archaeon]|nr:lysine biosynthesis protein [Candidatus Bathyarchaeota archaeon]